MLSVRAKWKSLGDESKKDVFHVMKSPLCHDDVDRCDAMIAQIDTKNGEVGGGRAPQGEKNIPDVER